MDLLPKRILLILLPLFLLASCGDSTNSDAVGTDIIQSPGSLNGKENRKQPEISFEQTEYNTGKISQGEVRAYSYKFTNTGNAPLIISEVSASCGCTVARDFPKGKIKPGEGGAINVEFDSDGKWGEQVVTVNVTTNAVPALTQLLIRTDIVAPDNLKTNN